MFPFLPRIRDLAAAWPVLYTVVVTVGRVRPHLNSIPTWSPAQVTLLGPILVSQVPRTRHTLGPILVPNQPRGEPLPLGEPITNNLMGIHLATEVHRVSSVYDDIIIDDIIMMSSHFESIVHIHSVIPTWYCVHLLK